MRGSRSDSDQGRPESRGSRPSSGGGRPDGRDARPYGRGDSGPRRSTETRSSSPRRDLRPGERRPERRPDQGRPTYERGRDDRPRRDDREREAPRPGFAAKANEPATPKGLDLRQLPRGVRAELRSLPTEKAEVIGAHLLMAGQLIDTDPELAYAHAEAARRRAARLPITREATAETAYAAGDFGTALSEFRALRRMTGGNEYLAAMADCERALGRPTAALKLVKEGLASDPDANLQIELRLVEAGVRADAGQAEEAMRLLKAEIESVGNRGPKLARARLRYGYADLLERSGDAAQAERVFESVVRLDPDDTTDAADRLAAIRGLVIDFDDSDEEDTPES